MRFVKGGGGGREYGYRKGMGYGRLGGYMRMGEKHNNISMTIKEMVALNLRKRNQKVGAYRESRKGGGVLNS